MSRTSTKLACGAAAFVLFGLAGGLYFNRGLKVRVHNSDSRALRSLVVSVTGNAYSLGDLPPGSTVSARVEPRGESSVTLDFHDGAGHPKQFQADVYIETGYKGTLSLDIDAEKILHKKSSVAPYP